MDRTLNILGYQYRIVFRPECEMGDGRFGDHNCDQQQIRIRDNAAPQGMLSTIIHEILEAANYHLHLELNHDKIMPLETALFQALTANGVDLSPLLPRAEGE